MYLKSIDDETLWLEITRYRSEEEYLNTIQKVNSEPVMKELFEQFYSCLVPEKKSILERNFFAKLKI